MVTLAALLLGGCAIPGMGGGSSSTIYDLAAPAAIDVGGHATRRQILVTKPVSVRALDTDRIVVRSAGQATLAYFADAQWSDDLPSLVQARLVEAFEGTGRVRAVGRPGQGLFIDVQVVPEIRAFEVVVGGGAPHAVVSISVKLMNDANGRVLASELFTATVPTSSDDTAKGVVALNQALDQVLSATVVWALRTL